MVSILHSMFRSLRSALGGARLIPLLLTGMALSHQAAFSQVDVDTTQGLVGNTIVMAFVNSGTSIEPGGLRTLRGDFKLSNPTVFFPQIFRGAEGTSVADPLLQRFTDSTYSFSVTVRAEKTIATGDTLFTLDGEGLAATDSVTQVFFSNLLFNELSLADFTATIFTKSIGPRLPYVRFAILDPGRPNPTKPGMKVTWGFRIDKASEVVFKIYDLIGQEIVVQDLGKLDKGVHINTFTPDFFFPSGMFIVRLITNSGEAFQIMHVLR